MLNIIPAFDNIIIEKDDPDEKEGRLFIPENRRKQQMYATVVAVGPGRVYDSGKSVACCVKPGDKIILRSTAGQEFIVDGETIIFIREDEIIGVINE